MKKIILTIFLLTFCVSISGAGITDQMRRVIAAKNNIDVTAPTWSSTTVATDGDTVTVVFSENLNDTALGGGEFDLDCDGAGGADNVLVYSSGDGTASWVMTTTTTIESGETCNQDFDGAANEAEDDAGNDLADFTDQAVTNNSTQGGASCTQYATNASEIAGVYGHNRSSTEKWIGQGNYDFGTIDICQIDFVITSSGTVSGITYYVDIYSVASDSFVSLIGSSSGVTGNDSWSAATVSFSFPSPVSLSSGTLYSILIRTDSAYSGTNYLSLSYSAVGGVIANFRQYDSAGDQTAWADNDVKITIYSP